MTTSDDAAREELTECRNAIEVVDQRIVALLAQRMELGVRAARAKRKAGLPIFDAEREAAVIRRVTAAAREHALATEPVKAIFRHVVGMSRQAQETAR